jgi:serine O-acetyltransferase
MLSTLKSDTYREYGEFKWIYVIKGFITNKTFRVIVTMRLCQSAYASTGLLKLMLIPLKICHRFSRTMAGVDLPWETKISPGFALLHGWGLVVNPNVIIGKNVTLFHGVTLGRRDKISQDGSRLIEYPIIEDEVCIGPHAIIVGGIVIGKGSRIAGGSFITNDIPPYSIVSGNPASIVKENCIPDVMNPIP